MSSGLARLFNHTYPWTEADDETLRRLYPAHGPGECAKVLQRSLKAVYRRAERLGLRRDLPTRRARALVAEGVPRLEAARRFGVRAYDVQRPRRRPRA